MGLAFDVRGKPDGREPMVFVHGFLGSGRNLASLARRVAEHRPDAQIILPDLPGHGDSQALDAQSDLKTMAAKVWQLLDTFNAGERAGEPIKQPWRIVGHSLGGRVALAMLAQRPEMFERVVLLDISPTSLGTKRLEADALLEALLAAPDRAPNRAAIADALRCAAVPEPLVQWLLMNLRRSQDGGVSWRIDRKRLAAFHQSVRNVDLWDVLEDHAIARRVQLIRGGRSTYVGEGDVLRLRKLGVDVVTLKNAGHFAHVDDPQGVLEAILAGLGKDL